MYIELPGLQLLPLSVVVTYDLSHYARLLINSLWFFSFSSKNDSENHYPQLLLLIFF